VASWWPSGLNATEFAPPVPMCFGWGFFLTGVPDQCAAVGTSHDAVAVGSDSHITEDVRGEATTVPKAYRHLPGKA
jgi:hypothetical protein